MNNMVLINKVAAVNNGILIPSSYIPTNGRIVEDELNLRTLADAEGARIYFSQAVLKPFIKFNPIEGINGQDVFGYSSTYGSKGGNSTQSLKEDNRDLAKMKIVFDALKKDMPDTKEFSTEKGADNTVSGLTFKEAQRRIWHLFFDLEHVDAQVVEDCFEAVHLLDTTFKAERLLEAHFATVLEFLSNTKDNEDFKDEEKEIEKVKALSCFNSAFIQVRPYVEGYTDDRKKVNIPLSGLARATGMSETDLLRSGKVYPTTYKVVEKAQAGVGNRKINVARLEPEPMQQMEDDSFRKLDLTKTQEVKQTNLI